MMSKLAIYMEYILGLYKSLYVNFKCLTFSQAVKLPIFISHRVKLSSVRGKIILKAPYIKTGMIKIGFGYVGIFDRYRSRSVLENNGTVVFGGGINIGHGCKLAISEGASLYIGNNFSITAETQIWAKKSIKFGDNVLISWQCLIMDTDAHKIYIDGQIANEDADIRIDNNVWIGCRTTILKGVHIPSGCIVGANSNVIASCSEENCILAGNPASVVKKQVTWKA